MSSMILKGISVKSRGSRSITHYEEGKDMEHKAGLLLLLWVRQ